jgi:hypothetical protein
MLRRLFPIALLVATAASAARFSSSAKQEIGDGYCWHDDWGTSSEWHCPDTSGSRNDDLAAFDAASSGPNAAIAEYDSVVISGGGRPMATALVHPNSDAVYISHYAVRNFLQQTFNREGKPEKAKAVETFVGGRWRPAASENLMMAACVHFDEEPQWQCTDARGLRFGEKMTVTMIRHHTSISPRRSAVVFPRGADALFFRRATVEKQLVPYYQWTNAAKAAALAKALASSKLPH